MKRIIAKIYRLTFRFTGARLFSYIFALAYATALNLVTIYGLSLLLADLFPTKMLTQLFSFPMIVPTTVVMLAINYLFAPSMHSISAMEKRQKMSDSTVAIYSIVSAVVLAYAELFDKIF